MTSHSSAEYFELYAHMRPTLIDSALTRRAAHRMKQDMHIFVAHTYAAWKRSNAAPEVLGTLFIDWYPKPVFRERRTRSPPSHSAMP